MVENENPYLVLGLLFGASREEAQRESTWRRFKSRKRQDPNGPTFADLTRACGQIEAVEGKPEAHLTPYRIPADPEALHDDGHGVFAPRPEPGALTDHHRALREMIRSHARAIDPEDL